MGLGPWLASRSSPGLGVSGTPRLLKADWLLMGLGWMELSTPPRMSCTWGTLPLCLSPTLTWILGPVFLLLVGPCLLLWRTALALMCPAGPLNSLPGCGKLLAHSCLLLWVSTSVGEADWQQLGLGKATFFHGERAGGPRPEGSGGPSPVGTDWQNHVACWVRSSAG